MDSTFSDIELNTAPRVVPTTHYWMQQTEEQREAARDRAKAKRERKLVWNRYLMGIPGSGMLPAKPIEA